MENKIKTVIMAGGKGTRISSIASDIPKPMIKIANKPILEHEIECLKSQGFDDIIITISHLGSIITDYFGDGSKISPVTGKTFGVHIEYFDEKEPLGNAGALFKIKEKLTDDFLLLNADSLFEINFKRFLNFHKTHGGLATIFTHPNSHPFDSGVIEIDADGTVKKWYSKEDTRPIYYKNRVNAGLHILSKKILERKNISEKVDLDRQILKPLCGKHQLYVYDSPEYVKDMGTPERLQIVSNEYNNGLIHKKNLINRQKAIFLDRDGIINKYVGFLTNIDQFELLPNVIEAIKLINNSPYLCIVVTNQPVIARGEVTYEELDMIHNKMETLLGLKGAYIDAIYYCPHHPNKGFPGEIKELKIDCDCRKPKPGMLLRAAKDFNIDLTQSIMIGDSDTDIQAGINANCKKNILLPTNSTNLFNIVNSLIY